MTTDDEAVDRGRLEELKGLDPTGAMLSTVIDTFEETCETSLEQLDQQLRAGDVDPARESAHTLAGRALMIGARTAGHLAQRLEQSLVDDNLAEARSMGPAVQESFDAARTTLAGYRA